MLLIFLFQVFYSKKYYLRQQYETRGKITQTESLIMAFLLDFNGEN